jgi:JmjC domain
MEDMDALISATRPHTDVVVVRSEGGVRSSQPIERDISGAPNMYWLYGMYHVGYTIIVNGAELRWPSIGELCRSLESELGHRVGANLYFTPSGAQGFLPHFDDHEVLILQIEGSKQWSLFPPPTELPLPETAIQVDTARLGRPRNLTVKAGDLLYVPRGVVHQAVASRKPSIHLTIGIHVTRWIDVIIDAMRMMASQDVRWRKALPVGAAQDKTEDLVGHLQHLLKTIPGEGDCHRALRERKDRFLARGRPVADGHFRSLERIASIGLRTRLRRRKNMASIVSVENGEAVIRFPGNRVTGPQGIEGAFRFISRSRGFAVHELPDELSDDSKIVLASRMVREGLFLIP